MDNIVKAREEDKNQLIWDLTIFDQIRIHKAFRGISNKDGYVSFEQMANFLEKTCSTVDDFEIIWCLCNPKWEKRGLTNEQFTVAIWLAQKMHNGISIHANSLLGATNIPTRFMDAVFQKNEDAKEVQISENVQTTRKKLDCLSDAVKMNEVQYDQTKEILERLKLQAKNLHELLGKHEICIFNEQVRNRSAFFELTLAKKENNSLQQIYSDYINEVNEKLTELEVIQTNMDASIVSIQKAASEVVNKSHSDLEMIFEMQNVTHASLFEVENSANYNDKNPFRQNFNEKFEIMSKNEIEKLLHPISHNNLNNTNTNDSLDLERWQKEKEVFLLDESVKSIKLEGHEKI